MFQYKFLLPFLSIYLFCAVSFAFAPQSKPGQISCNALAMTEPTDEYENENENKGGFLSGVSHFFNNLDAVADDFLYKRMGNGEVFYGKRKYKPSGNVEGDYDGMGLTDKGKIDMAREYREEWLEEKRTRDEMRMLREEKDKRNANN
mmetsp:Transcript_180/g.287  ORF Transcript_180/g.287 Transcript_180/m.287 type:complete len:147 (-) Transcript_180:124-564(-)